ncbi:ABC transporter transmembrane domain-containing protein, partial [Lysinibacillus sp. GbtcB16]|uniref:ABC transporter transmembrane domain-containing protein n=1 Tax=Lysinibacillus sp. GbtcB16 TaxID=2824761 RepID=UPI0020C608C0
CCAVGAELAGPYITKTIIDQHLSNDTNQMSSVLRLLGIYMGLLLVASICNYTQAYLFQSTALQIIKNMRMDLMRHIQ